MKSYKMLLLLVLSLNFLFAQTTNNYKEDFNDLIRRVKNESDYNNAAEEFFENIESKDRAQAFADISKDHSTDFIAENLYRYIKPNLKNDEFRQDILKQLDNKNNSAEFKIVTIMYMDRIVRNNEGECKAYNDILFNISKDKSYSEDLRGIAASKIGTTGDYNYNKAQINKLFKLKDINVLNGASKSLRKFLFSEISKSDREEFVDLLINSIDNNKMEIDKLISIIISLGVAKTKKSRNYLLSLFEEYSPKDKEITTIIVNSLSYNANEKIVNKIFQTYSENNLYNDYESELTLLEFAKNNPQIIKSLSLRKDKESKLSFLKAMKFRDENKKEFIGVTKSLLKDSSDEIRLQAVIALHFLLPHEKEKLVFQNHLKNEKSDLIIKEIYKYIGRI